uniref:Uncharacterized protein n=1 Tax=Strigamia maritima TaxID=126957 RepID=T1JP37_STRMM
MIVSIGYPLILKTCHSFISQTFQTTSSQIEKTGSRSCAARATNFLKTINVVFSGSKATSKASLIEVNELNSDINAGFTGDYVWLVPVWTTNVVEAATSIQVIIQNETAKYYRDMTKGAGGSYRYLKMTYDYSEERIVNVKLWRTLDQDSIPSKSGWKYWTDNINYNRTDSLRYLVQD